MRTVTPWAAAACGLLLAGCAADPYQRYELGAARPVVSQSIDMMGGLNRWPWARPIHAKALVTTYDSSGRARVNEQEQVIDLRGGTIRATARVPGGTWTAKVTDSGGARFSADGFAATDEMASRELAALRTLLHRLRGPLNLLDAGERPVDAAPARLPGAELIRVPVEGGREGIAAYYFDAQTSVLRYAAAGDEAPGGDGTVTIYSYHLAPDGMAFPSEISIVKTGRHVLVGTQPVMEVQYRQVRF